MKAILLFILYLFAYVSMYGQNFGDFKSEDFPLHLIDENIVVQRGLENEIKILATKCSWQERVGKKIDVFWLKTGDGNFFGHIYEYFMDCDNFRLIYWYASADERGEIIDLMIEPLEEDSDFVVNKRKHLKNHKKYRKYLAVQANK